MTAKSLTIAMRSFMLVAHAFMALILIASLLGPSHAMPNASTRRSLADSEPSRRLGVIKFHSLKDKNATLWKGTLIKETVIEGPLAACIGDTFCQLCYCDPDFENDPECFYCWQSACNQYEHECPTPSPCPSPPYPPYPPHPRPTPTPTPTISPTPRPTPTPSPEGCHCADIVINAPLVNCGDQYNAMSQQQAIIFNRNTVRFDQSNNSDLQPCYKPTESFVRTDTLNLGPLSVQTLAFLSQNESFVYIIDNSDDPTAPGGRIYRNVNGQLVLLDTTDKPQRSPLAINSGGAASLDFSLFSVLSDGTVRGQNVPILQVFTYDGLIFQSIYETSVPTTTYISTSANGGVFDKSNRYVAFSYNEFVQGLSLQSGTLFVANLATQQTTRIRTGFSGASPQFATIEQAVPGGPAFNRTFIFLSESTSLIQGTTNTLLCPTFLGLYELTELNGVPFLERLILLPTAQRVQSIAVQQSLNCKQRSLLVAFGTVRATSDGLENVYEPTQNSCTGQPSGFSIYRFDGNALQLLLNHSSNVNTDSLIFGGQAQLVVGSEVPIANSTGSVQVYNLFSERENCQTDDVIQACEMDAPQRLCAKPAGPARLAPGGSFQNGYVFNGTFLVVAGSNSQSGFAPIIVGRKRLTRCTGDTLNLLIEENNTSNIEAE